MTAQPSPVTGWSTGSGSTVGNPISLSHRVTCTEVAKPGHRIRRCHRGDARDGIGGGKVVDSGGEQADQPRTARIEPASLGGVSKADAAAAGKSAAGSRRLASGSQTAASWPARQRPGGAGGAERGELLLQFAGGAGTAVGRVRAAAGGRLSRCSFRLLMRRCGSSASTPPSASAAAVEAVAHQLRLGELDTRQGRAAVGPGPRRDGLVQAIAAGGSLLGPGRILRVEQGSAW